MNLLMDTTVSDFSNLLASKEAAPGGGSAAALSGVLGAALTMMVFNLTRGKKAYEALPDHIKTAVGNDFEATRSLFQELMELVDEDTDAFNRFMAAVKLPRETEAERQKRDQALCRGSRHALEIPLTVAGKCLLLLKRQAALAQYGNKNAVSDVGVGALLALAGLEGAALNVRINLPGISDDAVQSDARQRIEAYLEEGRKIEAEVMAIVNRRIETIS